MCVLKMDTAIKIHCPPLAADTDRESSLFWQGPTAGLGERGRHTMHIESLEVLPPVPFG